MKKSYFLAGLLLGAAVALIVWPDPDGESSIPPAPTLIEKEERVSIGNLLEDYRQASTRREEYLACSALSKVTSREMPEALSLSETENTDEKLREETKVLLAHWAGRNPEAALAWSWEHLRDPKKWEVAAGQILETWIASGDLSVLEFLKRTKTKGDPLVQERANQDYPLFLSSAQREKIQGWLYFYDGEIARAAFQQGIMPPKKTFADRLATTEDVRNEMHVWAGDEKAQVVQDAIRTRGRALGMTFPENEIHESRGIAMLGERSFKKMLRLTDLEKIAPHDLGSAFRVAIQLEPQDRHSSYLTIFKAWTHAHPNEQIDLDVLPPAARVLWRDLSALEPVDGK
jgi:hypothetical protein